ncbi:hypothetical protein Hdeb2414_s0017g00504991 [Helianthus debilis subsp. tardiflorus]
MPVLWEYGIKSIFHFQQDATANVQSLLLPSCGFHSFRSVEPKDTIFMRISSFPLEQIITGIHVMVKYRSLGEDEDNDEAVLFAKVRISKSTGKFLTWVYNPMVYCKPRVGEDVVWSSYWPIGHMLNVGDSVSLNVFGEKVRIIISGVDIMYTYSDVEEEENCKSDTMEEQKMIEGDLSNMTVTGCGCRLEDHTKNCEEVIGGDLSEFKVTTNGYYLCRRDLFMSETPKYLKIIFGDDIRNSGMFLFNLFAGAFIMDYDAMNDRSSSYHSEKITRMEKIPCEENIGNV